MEGVVGFDHLYKDPDYASWGVELAATFSFGVCGHAEEILVDSPSTSLLRLSLFPKANCAYKVNKLTHALLVKPFSCIVLLQHALGYYCPVQLRSWHHPQFFHIVGGFALIFRWFKRASRGTQNTFSAIYSSGSFG